MWINVYVCRRVCDSVCVCWIVCVCECDGVKLCIRNRWVFYFEQSRGYVKRVSVVGRERYIERGRERVCVCERERECVCVRERESVCERERECVCERERERVCV